MEEDNIFLTMSVSTPLVGWSVVLFLVVGYYVPLTMVTTGTTLRDLVLLDSMQR